MSYFEWVQDRHGYFWTEKEVNERLEAKMCQAFNAVLADRAEVQGRHARRRLHRRDQPRRDGDEDARDVRVRQIRSSDRVEFRGLLNAISELIPSPLDLCI